MLELYHSGLTTCSKQVRLTLKEKNLDYVSRYVDLRAYEHYSADYLKINPNGLVPSLVDDGRAIINSLAIMEYLDDICPEPPLRPADPKARADMRRWLSASDTTHMSVMTLTYNAFLKPEVEALAESDKQMVMAANPVPERRERIRRIAYGGYSAEEEARAMEMTAFTLGQMEGALEGSDWMVGDYSLADISLFALTHRLGELDTEIFDESRFPGVIDWHQRMLARPAVAATLEAGTAETPKSGPVSTKGLR
ncbi:MAG: glutathione S-transferase family protein [Rhodospirillales bacterium]|jgi:glutathione S-transferase|nr:glutathione S-transferase [Rhodospirillaceae bacterium]MDP6426675.1 glutathione S-transferase family protein [Rhodospirillales bacterium]MDP6645906.1 glutathione S-transferase family protein [Rhodospirillales bacterium]MDP6840763.1 glutathione S-transferase family protein [Rhodospirillales bacterium]|tara:strand:+ start:2320 stop:3075 length:756 start_codon:yes stop_codon:yes gene_type:complete